MTPQLQQAIRLLQLSSLELRSEIQDALESNLMLEQAGDEEGQAASESDTDAGDMETSAESQDSTDDASDSDADSLTESMDSQLDLDASWDEVYDGSTAYSQPDSEDERDLFENQSAGGQSLRDYLLWQLQLTALPERDRAIAETIVDAVGDDGYLAAGLDELRAGMPADWLIDDDDMEAVLRRVQHLDPVGVAARDPREALLIQLLELPEDTPYREMARVLIERHLELLANRQYAQLKRRMRIDQEALAATVGLIQTLNPRPGSQISEERASYVIPDVFVRRGQDGDWYVEINSDAHPRLRVNSYYASLVRKGDSSSDNTMMRQHLQEARWLIKSLRSRNDTLLRVAECIVERQKGFLEHGEEAMQPLVLREIAEAIDMHESTISRITTQKYMHTPRGTFEFKYFFSSHVQTVDGGECAATAIRARIRRLVAAEDPARPLSDSRLTELLRDEGINVARRTVAKYREAMAIASSTERKRLA
jgi:RNA polymerase sigma-54 factor